ncbi:MAG TPA: orotate phosphoribosyltransferase [Thermoplasmatales archaeon]|nr:orotate phosphoribosyltransferase [Thermoplasmatales archaeon]
MSNSKFIGLLKECGAIKFGKFVLTSGAVSDYYIDIKLASTNPEILKEIAKRMSKYADGYDAIAGMELGAVPLAVALSLETRIPFVIVRKEKKGHGTGNLIEGASVNRKKVLIVEDVTTSGGSVLKTIDILRRAGAVLDRVIVVVDRESGAEEKIEKSGLEFVPLIKVSEILKNC